MDQKKTQILITLPSLTDQGGVSSFFRSVFPHLSNGKVNIVPLEIGSTMGRGNRIYPVTDQLRFRKAIRKIRPGLVHVNPSLDFRSFFRDGLFILQARLAGLPVIVFFRGWRKDFEKTVDSRFLWFFELTYGKADAFIVLAEEFKKVLRKWGVRQPVYLGTTAVDESLMDNFDISHKQKQLAEAREIKILFLARLERGKGIFETVDAVSMLIRKGLPVSLSIAGDGEILKDLRQYVHDSKIPENRIRFLGYVTSSAKRAAFLEHHVYCLPTHQEGLPNSVLEAMAFGMPVVTRSVGGLADFFEDGKMGAVVKGKRPGEIASCLEKLVRHRQAMIDIGCYNAGYAKKHFLASVAAERLLEIYDTVASENLSIDRLKQR